MSKKIRLNVPLDLDINEKLDKEAAKLGVPKSGLIRLMIHDYFKQQEMMVTVDTMAMLKDFIEKKGE